MKKVFLVATVCILSISSTVFAQDGSRLKRLSSEVEREVERKAQWMTRSERQEVRSLLREILDITHDVRTGRDRISYRCEARTLYRLPSWTAIHSFSDSTDCRSALRRVELGKNFCSGADLYSSRGNLVRRYKRVRHCIDNLD